MPCSLRTSLHQIDERAVVGDQVLADARVHAGEPAARALDLLVLAAHLVHVGGRAAEVGDRRRGSRPCARSARTSRSTLSAERVWMTRPSCSVIEQKVQPPKQPRIVTIECFTVSNAGIGSRVARVRHAR